MRTIAAFALGLGLVGSVGLTAAQEKDDKKDNPPVFAGDYKLTAGKVNGKPVDEDAKKAKYTFAADKITIEGKNTKFVIGYSIDPKTDPTAIDMVILDGPEGTKGSKAAGIIKLKGDTLLLAYSMDKDKDGKLTRPKNFEGKEGMTFELLKSK